MKGVTKYSEWMKANIVLGSFIFLAVFIIVQPIGIPTNIITPIGAFTYAQIFGFGCKFFKFRRDVDHVLCEHSRSYLWVCSFLLYLLILLLMMCDKLHL